VQDKKLSLPKLNLKSSNSKRIRGYNKVIQSASKMANGGTEDKKHAKLDDIFDLSVD
jgi:hypothetical protein